MSRLTPRADDGIPPQTDDAPGPDNPLELSGTAWKDTVRSAVKEFGQDRCSMSAGSLAYHWFLALFPSVIAALAILALLHIGGGFTHQLERGLRRGLPPGAAGVFTAAVSSATRKTSGSTITVIVGLLVAVWSASAGFTALQTALDIAYEVPKDRKFVGKRIRALPMMAVTSVLGGIGGGLIVFGQPIGAGIEHFVPLTGTAFDVVWTIVRWVVTIAAISLLFSFFYFYGPNREAPGWQWISAGGVLGTLIFVAASLGFSFYVTKFGSYGKTYGAFAGVVILIFWFYLTGIAVLLGAEINAEIERKAAQAGGQLDRRGEEAYPAAVPRRAGAATRAPSRG